MRYKVVVWSDNVPNPLAVRYAWEDNPVYSERYLTDTSLNSKIITNYYTIIRF